MRNWLSMPGRRRNAAAAEESTARPHRKHPAPALPVAQVRTAWQVISLLLDYPDETGVERLPMLRRVVAGLPDEVRDPLLRLMDHLGSSPLDAVQKDYVDTFDTTRKCALHLTYYAHGDTRKRGVALVQFKQAFRRGGLEVVDDELPDHLAVVLEFGATSEDLSAAWKLVNDHRAGIELLSMGLAARPSPWVDAVAALQATLPPLDGDQTEAVAKLLREGPPDEAVGMDGYALDPRLNPHPDDDPDASFEFVPGRDAQGVLS